MKISRSSVLLLMVIFVIVQCKALARPVPNHDAPHKRTSSPTTSNANLQMCSFSEQSCHFYSHCVESHFHCGPLGFAQAYAEARCEAIDDLHHSSEPCDSCISSAGLYSWAIHQDTCLKRKLVETVESNFNAMQSDPPDCLRLERRGLELMRECYSEQSSLFCSALADNPTAFKRDIVKIVNKFRINSYYKPQVERALRNLIIACGDAHTSTADSMALGVHTPRIVFCVLIGENDQSQIDSSTAMELMSQNLSKPRNQFVFSGRDQQRRCVDGYSYPPEISPTNNDQLLFVTWSPDLNDPLIENLGAHARRANMGQLPNIADISFYEFLPLRSSEDFPECGDGKRQGGELCDMGVENCDDFHCDSYCQPTENVECSTGQFEQSECWTVRCGDGVRSAGEGCDDGNRHSGDGCSSYCKQEPDYECSGAYNRTSVCVHHSATTEPSYPPATTSSPSTLLTSSISRLSSTLPSTIPSSLPPLATDSITSHISSAHPPTLDGISSASTSTMFIHWRIEALQCLVSVLLSSVTVHLFLAR